ncbi:unnamed protein product [Microthlaspi erraticum]|uniref:RNase H type-1 domain-containing protein n=1 Tax=Microthlaspi erraticum TaxID=1685480 RepID=A0A6D2KEY9_9BRAS|nr:unnamed protein product [Microthlaspi erraticum]
MEKALQTQKDGGLGFRVIEDFNTTLLAKQLWRLIDFLESLFARVFKGRYYRNSTPLDIIRSYSPSYMSIVSARRLVQKGLIKRVGSGFSISVWEDPWIPAPSPRPAAEPGISFFPHLRVSELFSPGTATWNLPLLNQLFDSMDVPLILGIPTSYPSRPDSMEWCFTRTGRYTVKSGYEIAQQHREDSIVPAFGPDTRGLQAHVWKVRYTQNLQHFLWQSLTGCIAVGDRLRSRGMQIDPQCMRCGMAPETVNHTLFECPPALKVWALSPIPTAPSRFPIGSLFTNMAYLFWELPNDDRMRMYPWLIWCQVDGAWKETDCRAGLGWYYFNPETQSKLMGSCNLRKGISPLQTELEALIWAIQCMLRQSKLVMGFETDCSDVVKMVSKPEEWPAFTILLEEVDRCKMGFTSYSIVHIPRMNNTKADKLARSARALPTDVYYVNSVSPAWIPKLF